MFIRRQDPWPNIFLLKRRRILLEAFLLLEACVQSNRIELWQVDWFARPETLTGRKGHIMEGDG